MFAKILIVCCLICGNVTAQQNSDLDYKPEIAKPAYELGKGPQIGVDAAHNNYHTADQRYKPFAELLRRDGYQVDGVKEKIASGTLDDISVFVIANPVNDLNVRDWSLPTPSAFSKDEIKNIKSWVEAGGSLFLIADHMPFPGAAGDLAKSFGFEFSNGYAEPGHRPKLRVRGDVFDYSSGLVESSITRGRSDDEKVTSVTTFGGSAFTSPKNAVAIIMFGKDSISHETKKAPGITRDAPKVPIDGWHQGAVLEFGKGRIAVFGEAAMFSAQIAGRQKFKMGMNAPNAKQNHQLLLNVMHWLSRVKDFNK